MSRYISFFRETMNNQFNINNNQKLYLILDVYKSHRSEMIIKQCKDLNIELIFIPAGFTDLYQPLDIKVFGGLKAKARSYWYQHFVHMPHTKFTKSLAVKILFNFWNEL